MACDHNNIRQVPFRITGGTEQTFTFFDDYFDHHKRYPSPAGEGMMIKSSAAENPLLVGVGLRNESNINEETMMMRKRRLTSDQIDLLERSFREEAKLEPDRKMKLSRELGLPPRQVSVWFQNRRARWKNKQLERLYYALKQDFDIVSKDKYKLQQEVMKLRAKIETLTAKAKQVSTGYTEISEEEIIESTPVDIQSPHTIQGVSSGQQVVQGSYYSAIDDYHSISSPYWSLPQSFH